MKRYLLFIFFALNSLFLTAQDIPLFTQKLTNSFLYNPAVAGKTLGSITFSHRKYWTGIEGSPATNFLSFHTPLANHRFGFGVNLYQENIGVSQTLYGSAAFSYHIRFNDNNSFSMGLSAEYANFRVNSTKADVIDLDDVMLNNNQIGFNGSDFSFGLSYHSKFYKVGLSANRLASLTGLRDSTINFPQFYTGYISFMLPLANERDLLEPIINYRSLAPGSQQLEFGLYYTYNNKIILGGGYRTGSIINVTAAFKFKNSLTIGYSRDIYSGTFAKNVGSSNEFTLRFDFLDQSFYSESKNSRVINTQALALRRKTLSTYGAGGSPMQKSKRYKNKIKRNYIHSPNYRMSESRKLSIIRVKKMAHKRRKKY